MQPADDPLLKRTHPDLTQIFYLANIKRPIAMKLILFLTFVVERRLISTSTCQVKASSAHSNESARV